MKKLIVTYTCDECAKNFDTYSGCILLIQDSVDDSHSPDHCIYGKITNAKWEKQTTRY